MKHRARWSSFCLSLAIVSPIAQRALALDLHFDYTSFDNPNTPGNPHFGQNQFNVLNYPSINGNYMMTSTDAHRPEMVANGNQLAEFYNFLQARYNEQTTKNGALAADAINAYTVANSTNNGPRPDWIILNEISSTLWQQNPGTLAQSTYRTWLMDVVTRLSDHYDYNVVTLAPFATVGSGNGPSWDALAEKTYIGIENYLSGEEVTNGGSDYASRVNWARNQYLASKSTYTATGVDFSRLFLTEHFSNTTAGTAWGRAGLSAEEWDTVIQIRQDAILSVGFHGFLAYSWGGNPMLISEAEQIQHEYYYRSRLVLPTQQPQWLSDNAINVNGTIVPLSWSEPLNWIGSVPNDSGAIANFYRTNTAARSVTLDGSKTVGILTFNSPASYTIAAGTGGDLTLSRDGAAGLIHAIGGAHTISAGVQIASDTDIRIEAGAALTLTSTLSIDGGVTATVRAGTPRVASLAAPAGKLDVLNNKLVITAMPVGSWDGSAYTGVTGLVQSGRGGGTWNGDGIMTSMSDADTVLTTLAVATAGDVGRAGEMFGGVSVAASDVLVMYTWGGDADLDGDLDGDDYFSIDSSVAQSGVVFGYHNGDFNYEGTIDGDDYFIIDSNIGFAQSQPPIGSADLTTVPEPTALLLLAAALPLRRRRR